MSNEPFWMKIQASPMVACLTLDSGSVIALVLDPKNDNTSLYCANLRADQKDAFIAALKNPASVVDPLPGPNVDPDTVVITDTGGDGPGPKLYRAKLQ